MPKSKEDLQKELVEYEAKGRKILELGGSIPYYGFLDKAFAIRNALLKLENG